MARREIAGVLNAVEAWARERGLEPAPEVQPAERQGLVVSSRTQRARVRERWIAAARGFFGRHGFDDWESTLIEREHVRPGQWTEELQQRIAERTLLLLYLRRSPAPPPSRVLDQKRVAA